MTLLCVYQLPAHDNEPVVHAQRYIMTQRQEAVKKRYQSCDFFGQIFITFGFICKSYAC